MRSDFAVFILTHGRAKDQKTINTLRRCGYTGKIYLVVDDTDSQLEEYKKYYGDDVLVFDKESEYQKTDTFVNSKELRAVVYARNVTFKYAEAVGVKYFCSCDDDITSLHYKVIQEGKLKTLKVRSMDKIFDAMIKFVEIADMTCLSICESGAYIGGVEGIAKKGVHHFMSHFMLYQTSKKWKYRSFLYEDVIASIEMKKAGMLGFATTLLCMTLPKTGTNRGGMYDTYGHGSDYQSAFHVVMSNPDCTVIAHRRKINQKIDWNACSPKILNQRYRKV